MENLVLKLELTVEEVNGILVALGDLPTKTNAYILIRKIQEQAQPQLPPPPQEAPKAE